MSLAQGAEIKQFESSDPDNNKNHLKWYIGTKMVHNRYLHHNGKWFSSTQSADGWTGYYDTKEEAEEVLARYIQEEESKCPL